MSMKIRSMSAGRAGASVYNANVNGDQGGGDKKQGLAPTTNKRVNFVLRAIKIKAYSNPEQRSRVFCINQLGGIGRPSKMFATTADGVNKRACLASGSGSTSFLNALYQLIFKRNVDSSGLKTYSAILSGKVPSYAVSSYSRIRNLGFPVNEALRFIVLQVVGSSEEAENIEDYSDADNAVFLQQWFPIATSNELFD